MQGTEGISPAPSTLKKPYKVITFNLAYRLDDINYNSLSSGGGLARFLGHEGPDLVKVDGGLVDLVGLEVEPTLALLSEEAGMAEGLAKRALTISPS